MPHKFPLKEIALQAGLSLATVDRAIHNRPNVSSTTRRRVRAAQAELERQREQTALSGQQLVIDVVMEAPERFLNAVQRAIEAELPALRPANIRCRFHTAEVFGENEIVRHLTKLSQRGTSGVILKAQDTPQIREAISNLRDKKIVVITFVTEIGGPLSFPYVGMDNTQAGATAAWCLGNLIKPEIVTVLAALSSAEFSGEVARLNAFTDVLGVQFPQLKIVVVSEGFGIARRTEELVGKALDADASIGAVYSTGGANIAILKAFRQRKRSVLAFVGHDLDDDNNWLLGNAEIDAVIHHDLRQDARSAFQLILKHFKMLPAHLALSPTRVEICTRYNICPKD